MDNPVILDRTALRRRGFRQSNSTLLRLETAGRFPRRVYVGRKPGWLAAEIDAFLDVLACARKGHP